MATTGEDVDDSTTDDKVSVADVADSASNDCASFLKQPLTTPQLWFVVSKIANEPRRSAKVLRFVN